jgi:hypothetical protein
MLFNIFMGNHDLAGASSLEDQCAAFQGALRELGHDTFLSTSLLAPPSTNLVFENFVSPYKEYFDPHLATHRIGVIATERFEGSIINTPGIKAERTRNFIEVARRCSFIWCLDPVAMPQLRAAVPAQKRIFHTPIGYVQTLVDIEKVEPARKIWDICFTGMVTPYRQAVLQELSARGLAVIAGYFPTLVRRSLMARSRLQLTLRQTETAYMPSQMRIAYCLANDFPVVSDFAGVTPESPIEGYCFNVTRAQLAESCLALLQNPAAQAEVQKTIARFKSEYRMAALIADTVAQSIA